MNIFALQRILFNEYLCEKEKGTFLCENHRLYIKHRQYDVILAPLKEKNIKFERLMHSKNAKN